MELWFMNLTAVRMKGILTEKPLPEPEQTWEVSPAIRFTFRERIVNLTWMTESIKSAAIEKLGAMVDKIWVSGSLARLFRAEPYG